MYRVERHRERVACGNTKPHNSRGNRQPLGPLATTRNEVLILFNPMMGRLDLGFPNPQAQVGSWS